MADPKKPFAADSEIETFRYRGPDRRGRFPGDAVEAEVATEVSYDSKGNPVLKIRTDSPRRRKDDDTLDLLKCLEDSNLSLEDD
jgi:hypothetical protein